MCPNSSSIPLTDFDTKTTGTSLQMMKAFIPFLEPPEQRIFAMMIRIMEFNMTLDFFRRECFKCKKLDLNNPESLLSEFKQFCSPDEKKQIDMMIGMMKMQQFSGMATSSSPMDFMTSTLTPEQQKKYKEFENML